MKQTVCTRVLAALALAACLGIVCSSPASAAQPLPEEVVVVLPEMHPRFEFTLVPWLTPNPAGLSMLSHTQPMLGLLEGKPTPGTFAFTPSPDFWSLGFDSFTYTYTQPRADSTMDDVPTTVRVVLVAAAHGVPTFEERFTLAGLGAWDHVFNPQSLLVNAQAAIHGELGLDVRAGQPGYPRPAYLSLYEVTARGGDPDLGCGHVQVDVSAAAPPNGHDGPVHWIFDGRTASGGLHSRIGLRYFQNNFQIRVNGTHQNGSTVTTGWHDLGGNGPWRLNIDWWNDAPEHSAGLLAQVDSEFLGRLDGLVDPGFGNLAELRFGLNNDVASTFPELHLDNIRVFSGDPEPVHGTMHSDGFEEDLSGWTVDGNSNAVLLRQSSAITGRSGLRIGLLGLVPGYLTDKSPSAAPHYGFRLKMEAKNANISAQGPQLIFVASAVDTGPEVASLAATQALNDHLIEVWVAPAWGFGVPDLVVRVQLDDGSYATLPPVPLTGDPRVVDLQWWAAVEDGSNDGRLRVFLDGALAGELRGLDNDERKVDANYLGRLVGLPSAFRHTPTLSIDDFESWR